ncbi:VOC family protein (plasmid) [Sphingobium limneticum]|jgi:2,3-dihydroxybiphenyl 1,2-dioxygenase|uniref:VOC family protein n=1 Tax=Nitrobacter sp. TaxID=29420 RepID=UPI0016814F8B|nr:VOC family protein [Nitrobacter sp.]
MSPICNLGYVGLGVSDTSRWRDYALNILGLEDGGVTPAGDIKLRMDDYAYRILLSQNAVDDLILLGFEVKDAEGLANLQSRLEAAGAEVEHGSEELRRERDVLGLLRFSGPDNMVCEAFYGPHVLLDRPFKSPRTINGFQTGEQGLGHLTMFVSDREAAHAFFVDALGFDISDYIDLQYKGQTLTLTFLHCNARHHTIAFAPAPAPKKLAHLMLQLNSLDDVGKTLDLVQREGIPIAATLGRHTNDNMVSFYMHSPAGFEVEYGWGAREVHPHDWRIQRHTASSIWGHHRGMA